MRYERLLQGLERARSKYEDSVRRLLAGAQRQDEQTDEALRTLVKPKKIHWTKKAKNRKKVLALHRKMQAAKQRKK